MARERRRLLIAPERLAAAAAEGLELPVLALTAEESRYLTRVLRYGPGDVFAVINGAGSLWPHRCRISRRLSPSWCWPPRW
jgi:16S rRNA (uracil1498-N3)-methyltransferase